jgi:hypothetical protein
MKTVFRFIWAGYLELQDSLKAVDTTTHEFQDARRFFTGISLGIGENSSVI